MMFVIANTDTNMAKKSNTLVVIQPTIEFTFEREEYYELAFLDVLLQRM